MDILLLSTAPAATEAVRAAATALGLACAVVREPDEALARLERGPSAVLVVGPDAGADGLGALLRAARSVRSGEPVGVLALADAAALPGLAALEDLEPFDLAAPEAGPEELRVRLARLVRRTRRAAEGSPAAGEAPPAALSGLEGVGTFAWSERDDVAEVSAGLVALLGEAPGVFEPTPAALAARLHPDDRAAARAAAREVLTAGGTRALTVRVLLPGGEVRWLALKATGELAAGGRPARLRGLVEDVTREHLRAEVQQAARNQLRALFDASPDAIFLHRRDGSLADVNRRFTEIYGFTREEALTADPRDLMGEGASVERSVAMLERAFAGEQPVFEWPARRQSGETFLADVRLVRVELPGAAGGDPAHVLAVVRDKSERQSLEARLLQAQKMESIGRLAGGVAHDFNNLLTGILGNVELMEGAGQGCVELGEVRKAAERAAALTRQLLAFSRRQVLNPRVVDLNEAVQEGIQLIRRLIGEHIDVAFAPAERLWAVRVDPAQMQQVLMNLAVNARDAMPEGGRLTIATRNVALGEDDPRRGPGLEPGAYVELAVSDTGEGMDAATLERIWEPFFTTKERGKGTGLGLATVFGIVQQSGGHVTATSEPGAGACFRVLLPRVHGRPADALPAGERPVARGRAETVLVVEDDELVRSFLASSLRSGGYEVLATARPEEALDTWDAHRGEVRLLVADVVMPGMSGPDLAQRLRAEEPSLPVVYISGYSPGDRLASAVAEEGASFIAKPFRARDLLERVRASLDRAQALARRDEAP